jgi:uncharacterized protein YndB with AHSA1/START domain
MGDYHITMQFDMAADQEPVRRALTTRDGIASWWSERTTLGDPGGGNAKRLEVSFPDVPQPFEFDVSDDAPNRIEWRTGGFPPWWAGTTIRWDLSANPDGPGTRVLFSHRDYEPDNPVIPIVTPAWAQIILRLKAYAETGEPDPFFRFVTAASPA